MMRSSSVVGLAVAAAALGLVGGAPAGGRAGVASAVTCRSTYPPDVGDGGNRLTAVSVTSSRNAWAVGSYFNGTEAQSHSLVERWDGTAWKVQPSPSPGAFDELLGVTATSVRNAWAVGDYYARGPEHSLIEHWGGRAWKVQPTPGVWALQGAAATSFTNAWAVGALNGEPLIVHWNGTAWKVQTSPHLASTSGALSGVAATSPINAWAVGYTGGDGLIEHWNGKAWKVQLTPRPRLPRYVRAVGVQLFGVAATSAADAWAAGYSDASIMPSGGEYSQTLIEHWDGHAWHVQASPNPGGGILRFGTNQLFSVAATSPANAWAVGGFINGATAEHWNGSAWRTSRPVGSGNNSTLLGVSAESRTTMWAVGSTGQANLALHCR